MAFSISPFPEMWFHMKHDYNAATVALLRSVARQVLDLDPAAPDFASRLANLKASAAASLQQASHLKPGNPRIAEAQRISAEVRTKEAEERRQEIVTILGELRARGLASYPELAKALNDRGIKPPRAKLWTARNLYAVEKPQDR